MPYFNRLPRIAFLAPVLVALAMLTGCESIQRTPVVDILDTSPPLVRSAAYPPTLAPTTGSLYSSSRYRPAFEDRRARLAGDTVTIQIVENVSASQKSTSTVDKSGTTSSSISAFPFMSAKDLAKLNANGTSSNVFAGKGGTESANTFSGSITATVVDVLPNGHLVVTGEKQIGVNQNVDVLRFSGTIDPRSIQAGNLVASTQVSNVRVESRGRGQQGEAQAIGWLGRFFLTLSPF